MQSLRWVKKSDCVVIHLHPLPYIHVHVAWSVKDKPTHYMNWMHTFLLFCCVRLKIAGLNVSVQPCYSRAGFAIMYTHVEELMYTPN